MVLFHAPDRDRLSPGKCHAGGIRDITWLCDKYLFPRVHDGADRDVKGLGYTARYDYLVITGIGEVVVLGEIPREGNAKGLEAFIGRVGCRSLFDRINTGFADIPRGAEIRLPDAKRYDPLHREDEIEKFPDSRWRDLPCTP